MLPGTCIPKAYVYTWNDEVLAQNTFASVLESSAGTVIRAMDTRGDGTPWLYITQLPSHGKM